MAAAAALHRLFAGEVLAMGPRTITAMIGGCSAGVRMNSPTAQKTSAALVMLEAQARFTRLLSGMCKRPVHMSCQPYIDLEALLDPNDQQRSVAACAHAAGLNDKYASRLFKQYIGLHPLRSATAGA